MMNDKKLELTAATQLEHATVVHERAIAATDYRRLGWLQFQTALLYSAFMALVFDAITTDIFFALSSIMMVFLPVIPLLTGQRNRLKIVRQPPKIISIPFSVVMVIIYAVIIFLQGVIRIHLPLWITAGFPIVVFTIMSGYAALSVWKGNSKLIPEIAPTRPLSLRSRLFTVALGIVQGIACTLLTIDIAGMLFLYVAALLLLVSALLLAIGIFWGTGALEKLGAQWGQIHWITFYCGLAFFTILELLWSHTTLIGPNSCILVGVVIIILFLVSTFFPHKEK